MKTSNQEVVVETTQTETETLAFQVASRDLGPFIVDAGGHHPDPLSPLAPDLESYAPGSTRPSSDLEAVLAHPRARDVASVVACPSLKLWGRTGGGTVPVSSFAVCGRPAIHPDLFVVVSPSFEDAFVLEVLEGIEEVAAWWADTLASPVEDDRPNLLPPPIALETLVYAFHTIDAFRRATLEGMLAYTTTEQPAISADEFSDSLLRAIGSRDLRWLLPAFLHLVPGLDVAGIDPRSEHLLFLVNQSFFVPAAEREDDRDVLVFGEAGIALGAEFHHGWLSAAGFELLVRSDGRNDLSRAWILGSHSLHQPYGARRCRARRAGQPSSHDAAKADGKSRGARRARRRKSPGTHSREAAEPAGRIEGAGPDRANRPARRSAYRARREDDLGTRAPITWSFSRTKPLRVTMPSCSGKRIGCGSKIREHERHVGQRRPCHRFRRARRRGRVALRWDAVCHRAPLGESVRVYR